MLTYWFCNFLHILWGIFVGCEVMFTIAASLTRPGSVTAVCLTSDSWGYFRTVTHFYKMRIVSYFSWDNLAYCVLPSEERMYIDISNINTWFRRTQKFEPDVREELTKLHRSCEGHVGKFAGGGCRFLQVWVLCDRIKKSFRNELVKIIDNPLFLKVGTLNRCLELFMPLVVLTCEYWEYKQSSEVWHARQLPLMVQEGLSSINLVSLDWNQKTELVWKHGSKCCPECSSIFQSHSILKLPDLNEI
jgi:hypothetical protein